MKPIPAAALTVSLLALVALVTLHQPALTGSKEGIGGFEEVVEGRKEDIKKVRSKYCLVLSVAIRFYFDVFENCEMSKQILGCSTCSPLLDIYFHHVKTVCLIRQPNVFTFSSIKFRLIYFGVKSKKF